MMPNELLALIPKAEGIRTHESLGIMLRCMLTKAAHPLRTLQLLL